MSNRVCRDCRAIYNPQSTGARNGRCPTCARTADQARGTRTDRGYGPQHQALRTHWQQRINACAGLAGPSTTPATAPDTSARAMSSATTKPAAKPPTT